MEASVPAGSDSGSARYSDTRDVPQWPCPAWLRDRHWLPQPGSCPSPVVQLGPDQVQVRSRAHSLHGYDGDKGM